MASVPETGPTFEINPVLGGALLLLAGVVVAILMQAKKKKAQYPTLIDRMNDMHGEK